MLDKASATETKDEGLNPGQIKQRLLLTASMLDVQQ